MDSLYNLREYTYVPQGSGIVYITISQDLTESPHNRHGGALRVWGSPRGPATNPRVYAADLLWYAQNAGFGGGGGRVPPALVFYI